MSTNIGMIRKGLKKDISVSIGVEDEGLRNIASVQLLSYLYREPDAIVSENNPAFVLWSRVLGLDAKAVAEAMKRSPERLQYYRGCDTHKVDPEERDKVSANENLLSILQRPRRGVAPRRSKTCPE